MEMFAPKRSVRPLTLEPIVSRSELRYIRADDISDKTLQGLPSWFQMWGNQLDYCSNVDAHLSQFRCAILSEFAKQLFGSSKVAGILTISQARSLPSTRHPTWLVLRSRADRIGESLDKILNARPGEYYFLHEPNSNASKEGVGAELLNRFFHVFGGLRDTAPFSFGSDGFLEKPLELPTRALKSREHSELDWMRSLILHKRGNLDYLILHPSETVGYLPTESERRIQIYAENFSAAIMKWLDDPLRDWDAMRC